jgi:hypothetical protein
MQGTLGDMMFQYVLGRSLAEDNGLALECLRAPARWNDWFPHAPLRLDGRRLAHPPLRIGTGADCHRLDIDEIRADGRAIHLDGFFQRLEYYAGRLADAATWFATSDDGRPALEPDDLVVHVKANVPLATRGWVLPPSYYREAVESMPRGSRILVCGDHASVDLAIPNRDVRFLEAGVRRQFSMLRRARYSVLSNDTTAWWAGALSNAVDMVAPETSTGAGFAFAGFEDVDLKLPTPPYRGIDVPRFADATIVISSKVFGALAFSRAEGQAVVLPTGSVMHCPSGSLPAELLTALVSRRTLTSSDVPGGVRSTGLKWAVTHGLADASLAPVH